MAILDTTPKARKEERQVETRPVFECVFLSSSERDLQTVTRLLKSLGIHVHHAALLEQAELLLTVTDALVLLSDMKFLDGSWTDAQRTLDRLHPHVALVLAVEDADEQLWIDVLEQGVYDLVLRPFSADELRRILQNAHAHAQWNGRAAKSA